MKTAFVLASLALCGLPAAAASITNPTFTSTTLKGDQFNVTKGINSWEIGSGNVDRFTGTFWQMPKGIDCCSIDLNGNQPGSIAQNVTATAGDTYRITFLMSGDPNDPQAKSSPNNKTMTVTVKGFPLLAGNTLLDAQPFSFDTGTEGNTLANMMWTQMQTDEFVASGNFRVIFQSTTKGLFGPAITDVQVQEVAALEPTAFFLMGGGLLALGIVRRRARPKPIP